MENKRRVGKPQTVIPNAPNLVSTWRAIVTRTCTLTEALETINTTLNMKITHSRITEWEHEEKTPSTRVANYMLATVMPVLLKEQGVVDESKIDELILKTRMPGL